MQAKIEYLDGGGSKQNFLRYDLASEISSSLENNLFI